MNCTDEDLNQWKDDLVNGREYPYSTPVVKLLALLARLEAAERLFDFRCVTDAIVSCKEAAKQYENWRKECGK